jgi:hypothetical protein
MQDSQPNAKQGAGGGDPTPTIAQYREAVKRKVVSIGWEMGMLIFVLVYFVVVFLTFAFEDQKVCSPSPRTPILSLEVLAPDMPVRALTDC